MDQFALHILGNNNSTSIEFVEKQYKLDAGETLVGKDNDFPEKQDISNIITSYDGWKAIEGDFVVNPNKAKLAINLRTLIDSFFPASSQETTPDRGITCEVDFFFFVNHIGYNEQEEVYHLAVTANKLIRFNIMKTVTESESVALYVSTIDYLSETGNYVIYDSSSGYFTSVRSNGNIRNEDITLSFSGSGNSTAYLNVTNDLQRNPSFSANPRYPLQVQYKLRMKDLSYPFGDVVNEYTSEI